MSRVNFGWQSGGRSLTTEQENAAQIAIERAGGISAFELIVLSGSLVAGLGHGLSDVDLFVVPKDGVEVDIRRREIDGEMVQLNHVTGETLYSLADSFGEYRVTPGDRLQLLSVLTMLRAVSRIAWGRLIHVSDEFREVYESCDRDVIRQLVLTHSAIQVGRHVEDAMGGLEAGDALIALQGAAAALTHACNAVLASVGDIYAGDAFLWRRLARADPQGGLVQQVWHLLRTGPPWASDDLAVRRHVEETIALATYVVSRAQLDAWDAPSPTVPRPPLDGGRSVRRSPAVGLVRFGNVISLAGPDKAFRVNVATADAWLEGSLEALPDSGQGRLLKAGLLVKDTDLTAGGEIDG